MMVLGIFTSLQFSNQLITLVLGGIGPLLVLVGAFIVWLESDELRVHREERSQESEEVAGQQTLQQRPQGTAEQERDAAREIKQAVERGGPDPQDILSGTVDEVKEQVSSSDDLDTKELLEAEKQGKNRKTLVNYLERRVD